METDERTRLVLARRRGESILIRTLSGVIEVYVAKIQTGPGKVKLCVQAPRACNVIRKELQDRQPPSGRVAAAEAS